MPTLSREKSFNQEDYSIDFLKEKNKPICYYLFSYLNITWYKVKIYLHENGGRLQKIIEIDYTTIFGGDCYFLRKIDRCFDEMKTDFCYQIPTKPFRIMIVPIDEYEEIEEESDKEEKLINTTQSFKSDECVICLTNPPNVLFCNCGHLCLCVECNKVKDLYTCPVCKTENTIKRNIE